MDSSVLTSWASSLPYYGDEAEGEATRRRIVSALSRNDHGDHEVCEKETALEDGRYDGGEE